MGFHLPQQFMASCI